MRKRGSANEDSVQKALRERSYIERSYNVGQIPKKRTRGISCSSDGILLLDFLKLRVSLLSDWQSQK